MIKKTLLAFFILSMIACSTKDSKTVKKEFDNDGNLIQEVELINGLKNGKSIYYYSKKDYKYSKSIVLWKNDTAYYQKNYSRLDKLLSEGPLKEYNFKIDKWRFYDSEQNLKEVQEFVDFQNSTYLNQNWIINAKGDTIGGNYYKFILNDTLKLNSTNRGYFFLERPLLSDKSDLIVCLSRNNDFEKQFYENDKLEFDTINSLALRFKDKELYQDKNHHVLFDFDAEEIGEKEISGFLIERDKASKDEYDFVTKKTFFRHKFYVKE